MIIKSITTFHGAAVLIEAVAPILIPFNCPPGGWGVVVCGDRVAAMTVAVNCYGAAWVADYSGRDGRATVIWTDSDVPVGTAIEFDSTLAQNAICPHCGSTQYRSKGRQWQCKGCGKTWLKGDPKPRGGRREGAGRKCKAG